jgi:hypothetical protein
VLLDNVYYGLYTLTEGADAIFAADAFNPTLILPVSASSRCGMKHWSVFFYFVVVAIISPAFNNFVAVHSWLTTVVSNNTAEFSARSLPASLSQLASLGTANLSDPNVWSTLVSQWVSVSALAGEFFFV